MPAAVWLAAGRSGSAPGRAGAAWRSSRCAAASWPRTARSGVSVGVASRIASMSSAKPMSSISSASSSTTISTAVELQRAAGDVVERTAGRGDHDVDAVVQRVELAADRLAAVDRQHLGAEVAAVLVHRLGHLHGELAGGHQDERVRDRLAVLGRHPVEDRQRERRGLAGAGGRLAEEVAALRAAAGWSRAGWRSAPRSRGAPAPTAARDGGSASRSRRGRRRPLRGRWPAR